MEEVHSIGAKVEVYNLYHEGWIPRTIFVSVGNQIEVEMKIEKKRLYVDVSRVRPRLLAEKDNNRIFKENEVEVFEKNNCWVKGEIWEVHATRRYLFYFVKDNVNDSIDVPLVSKSKVVHSIGAKVEVHILYHGEWILGTIFVSVGNQIEVEMKLEKNRLYVDASRVRPRLSAKKDNNQIFKENEVVEVLEKNNCWVKGEIWEVSAARKNLLYFVKNNVNDNIDVHLVSKSKMLKETNMQEMELNIDAEVEVYSFKTRAWRLAIILQVCENHIEVDTSTKVGSLIRKEKMYVDAFRIRPPPPLEVENDQKFNCSDLIKIWTIHSQENKIFFTILNLFETSSGTSLQSIIKNTCVPRWNWVDGKWIFPSFGTSLQPISNFSLLLVLNREKELPHNVLKVVDEQHNAEFSTVEVGISNANMLVGASSFIMRKVTRTKTNITWGHCKILHHPSIEGKNILRCNYCGHEFMGGDATPCQQVPQSVRNEIQNDLKRVPTKKKFKQGNAPKEIQGKYHPSASIRSSAKGRYKSYSQGTKLKTGPTGISGLSGVDGQKKVVEKDTLENMSYKSITATSHVNDEMVATNVEEAIDAIIHQRDSNEIYEIAIDVKEYKYKKYSGEEFTPKYKAIKTTIPMIESIDQASTFRYVSTTIVKQGIEVQKNTHDSSSSMRIVDISTDELKSSCKKIQTHMIPIHLKSKFDWIFYYHGDVLRNCSATMKAIIYHFIVQMCERVQQIQATNYENISEIKITEWLEVCLDHKSMNIDNEWLMNTVKALDNCLKEKQVKIKNEIVKIDMDMRIENIDGDIFTKCLIASKDTCHLLLKQMREVNISKDIILEWDKVCLDHNITKMDNEWLTRSVKELENYYHGKTVAKSEALELKYNVKEKIENEIRNMDLIPEPSSSSKQRKPNNEDVDDKELVIGCFHATPKELQCLQDEKWINNTVVNIFGQMLILKQEVGRISRHYFPTYFGEKIVTGCSLNDMKNYYAEDKLSFRLTHCEQLFIPMCLHDHWFLYMVNLKDQKLHILNSIQREDNPDQHIVNEIVDDIKTFRKAIKADLLQFFGRRLKGKF
ncbi:hypothetical protein NE237_002090 [Protea cynaroides]|uniref:Ubiquitin-like protease family profile domain-containing protein n=1 Tax=Protea cynaroides TaxID=273540 RepID=A0A9Q0KUS4_9MAGN|nr:hypothetical protein NE237_002090 [Protea cynaroides]